MRHRPGITEAVWQSLPADKQLLWRLLLLVGALLATPIAGATGQRYVDIAIAITAVLFGQITVESQRSLSVFVDGRLRKRLIRLIVVAGKTAVLVLGCAFFLGIAAIASSTFLRPELLVLPSMHRLPALTASLGTIIMAMIIGRALFKVFRDCQMERAMWLVPGETLRMIFVERRYLAASLPELIALELMMHVVIFGYFSMASSLLATAAGWTPLPQ
jgi:hypothetical protein